MVKDRSLSDCLVIPEDFKDWLHDSVYPDLLTFESDLAQTSTLIIIALESPGSIAELGSFSVNNGLKDKIITIISQHHHSQQSFITLGPLRQIPEVNVYSYPYDHNSVTDSLDHYLSDIVNDINEHLSSIRKTEKFNKESNGHVALLIYDLLLIFKALKFGEILEYLRLLACERNQTITKRLLFLLKKLSLVSTKRIGNVDYFIALKTEHRINFSSKDKSKLFNRDSTIIGTAQYYTESNRERMRKRAFEQSGAP